MAFTDVLRPGIGLEGVGKAKMEPMTGMMLASLVSSALGGLFGGSDQQEMHPYRGAAAPQQSLESALQAIKGFGANMESRGPARLRTTMAPPARPVTVPGLGFQIGGGLGHDPAIDDIQALIGRGMGQGTPFQSAFSGTSAAPGTRQRQPNPVAPDASSLVPGASQSPGLRQRKPSDILNGSSL